MLGNKSIRSTCLKFQDSKIVFTDRTNITSNNLQGKPNKQLIANQIRNPCNRNLQTTRVSPDRSELDKLPYKLLLSKTQNSLDKKTHFHELKPTKII